MDLIILVLVLCLVGFVVYILTTKIPMPPYWATIIQVLVVIVLLFFLLRQFPVPNLLH